MVIFNGADIFTIEIPYVYPTTDQQMKVSHGEFLLGS